MSNNNTIEYTIGWICALPLELVAAEAMLDCRYADDSSGEYTLGRIGAHNVVIACLPAGLTGTNAAATVAARMMSTYTSIRLGLMVGIGGGVPSKEFDIRLGDVVVSQPRNGYGGVVQYDFGKSRPGEFELTGFLNTPPIVLLSALSKLQADYLAGKSKLSEYLQSAAYPPRFALNTAKTDVLFEASYDHLGGATCEHCSEEKVIDRPWRDQEIVVHYGTIASGNQVMRDGNTRDRLSSELGGVLCFEMEAAGLMNSFPCLVIRGICDYADSHKNKTWQPYAAAVAAAYAKEILVAMPGIEVSRTQVMDNITKTEMLRADIETAIDALDLRQFLSMLPPVDLERSTLDTPPLDRETPNLYWIFRNEDFRNWDTADSSRILWLVGPPWCNLREAASSIIHLEMARASTIPRLVLYFFCSPAVVGGPSITDFILAIVHQIILSSAEAKQASIASTFLRGVLSDKLKNLPSGQSLQFPPSGPNSHVRNLLRASDNSLWAALWAIMPSEHNPELAIYISGIEHVRDNRIEFIRKIRQFVDDLQRTSKVKILLTSGLEKDTAKEFDGLPYIEYDKERKECLSSLFFVNTRLEKIAKASGDTFEWLWEHPQYKRWSNPEVSSILLIEGKPGSGKSTLTKYFNEHVLERQPAANSAIVSRFFYSYREGNPQRSHYNMLRSIIYDILCQDLGFFYHIQHEYRLQSHRQSVVEWNYGSLKQVLSSLINYSLPRPLYLIIDAVDESEQEDRRQILKVLFELGAKTTQGIVKIFIASQPVDELEVRGKNIDNIIQLQAETASDISRFTRSMLEDLNFSLLLVKATEYIVDNAHGVFLWVKLIGNELELSIESGESEDAIFEHLEQLPTGLDDFYQLMFMRLNSKPYTPDSMIMFQSVFWAAIPLTVDELLHAVAISNTPDIEYTPTDNVFERRIPAKGRITSCGGNFLEAKRSNGKEIVQVMHQTVREFFLSPIGSVANSRFRMNDSDANICISKNCIRYLMLCAACTTLANRLPAPESWTSNHFGEYASYLDRRPFANYALCFLRHHTSGCQDTDVTNLAAKLSERLNSGPFTYFLENWAKSNMDAAAVPSIEQRSISEEFVSILLQTAVWNGLPIAVGILLAAGADVNSKCEDGQTALLRAASQRHEAVAKVLLTQNDIDVNQKDEYGQTALSVAAEKGHKAIAEMLLDRSDIAADTRDKRHRTPLSLAAEQGHKTLIELLITRGDVDVDAIDLFALTPLSHAAKRGHDAVVKMLLTRHDFKADSRDRLGLLPLLYAAERGHHDVVKLLLAREDVMADSRDDWGWTPLLRAASRGHHDVVRLLISFKDIKADCKHSFSRQTPLSLAAQHGHLAVAELLLACKDVKADSRDIKGWTPLSWAARQGHQAIVELLVLREDVKADRKDVYGRTPISWAAARGHQAVVELLNSLPDDRTGFNR